MTPDVDPTDPAVARALTGEEVLAYQEAGHVLLPGLLSPAWTAGIARDAGEVAASVAARADLADIAARLLDARRVAVQAHGVVRTPARTPVADWTRDAPGWSRRDLPGVTMWLPLQDTSVDLGTPQFASGTGTQAASDRFVAGLGSPDNRQHVVDSRYVVTEVVPMALGDATFHGGWTAHRVFGNTTDGVRAALTVTWQDLRP